ncbi:MAG: glycosyltransferase [Acidobacteria bacterium]|nr:glycosyltransferase [Acidobacteriota bacterium]MYF13455.1 glycosyltransferase [Acidobacteriota bacterium]MYI95971.1 glycosyltransferase [Acidobacteriota bacterium]
MYRGLKVGAVVPARDEERNIGPVVRDLLALRDAAGGRVIDDFVVCDNGSADRTALRAQEAGARVVRQDRPGYGIACLTALAALAPVDVVLFTDGDGSFAAVQAERLLAEVAGGADLVIGSRVHGRAEPGALSVPQVAGNRVAALLIRLLWGQRISDLGPYRAIRAESLRRIAMEDRAYGWTVEMQIKAIQHGLRVVETPVDTRRRRFGRSKVGGTVRGVAGASAGILRKIARLFVEQKTHSLRIGRRKEVDRS